MASSTPAQAAGPHRRISVIVPTFHEQHYLADTLTRVLLAPGDELIVVDGGSTDETRTIAQQFTPHVLQSPPGRATQMNYGAQHASGDILLFLHADTLLPADGLEAIRTALQDPTVVGGAFRLAFFPDTPALRLVAWGTNLRSRFGKLPYGDQALFVPRQVFTALGGYDQVPFMEDVRLVQTLRQRGRLITLPHTVQTSGRRWQRDGVFYTTGRNTMLVLLYFCGVSPVTLKRWYTTQK